jgi:EAL domain-containing protein (putative c-di-GMP-specific phosphodiesterase class I)
VGDARDVPPQLGRSAIDSAIRARAFRIVYQPIVHLETGELAGVEALCRCDDGTPPDVWFDACELHGVASAMDAVIVQLVLEDFDRIPPGYVAVNLSAATLETASPSLLALVGEAARERQLVLELTEHSAVSDYKATVASLATLRKAGVLFAVDDAGAGHSTFRHIVRLGPDIIKLDRSIIERIDCDPTRKALVGALVIFAGEVGAVVVAEGIETAEELAAVRAAGVSRGQGYGLARPQPLPLAELDYLPAPFVDLIAQQAGGRAVPGRVAHGRLVEPSQTVHRVRAALASMENGIGMLRRSDGRLPRDEFRALCASLARQLERLGSDVDDVAELVVRRSESAAPGTD